MGHKRITSLSNGRLLTRIMLGSFLCRLSILSMESRVPTSPANILRTSTAGLTY